ncbi:MAG: hypothetical protein WAV13_06405 [Thermodesulfovibrionales bacterium]
MVGTKVYQKKTQAYFFLAMYGLMAVLGFVLIARSVMRNQPASNAAGFMIIFGVGMFILTLVKSRKPQVYLCEDFLELNQSRTKQIVRYRNITKVSRRDKNRLVLSLWEDGRKKEAVIWLKELAPADVEKVSDFLAAKSMKGIKAD